MTTPNMGLLLPTDHASNDVWDVLLDAVFALVDSHNHTAGRGVKVPTGGLNIDADISFSPSGTPRALTDLKAIDFAPVASSAVTSLAGAFFVSDGTGGLVSGELYFRSTAGTNIRVTNGAALNVAAFTGGIGGDYTAVGAAVAFDDALDRYTFKQQGNLWARMASGEVRILETGTTESLFVGIACPAALAGSYTITLPLVLPGSTSLVQMDSSGVLTASNVTIGGTPNFTGAVTMASTLGVSGTLTAAALTASGLITANAGVTAGANQHVTVSGTGRLKHGTVTLSIPVEDFVSNGAGPIVYNISASQGLRGSPDPIGNVICGIRLLVGQRITAIRVFIADSATGPTKMQSTFISVNSVTGAASAAIAASAVSAGTGANQTLSMTGLTTTVAASTTYHILVVTTTGAAADFLTGAEVDYDFP